MRFIEMIGYLLIRDLAAGMPTSSAAMPEVMSRMALNAQQWVQSGLPSLSNPLFYPVGTLAQGNRRNYFLHHSQSASIL
jgi:hypothetical protein